MANQKEKQIHYFPGHMKKGLIKIEEKLKLIDFVIILLDSRIPISSINHDLLKLVSNKQKLFLLSKKDMSDQKENEKWLNYFNSKEDTRAILVNLKEQKEINNILNEISYFKKIKDEKYLKKGIKNVSLRGMILGIPNVGKSTLINLLNKKNVVISKNMPGATKNVNWIKIDKYLELMDTPGILLPKFENHKVALNLALIGTIKEDILPLEEVFEYLISFIKSYYISNFNSRFNVNITEDTENDEIINEIAKKRGYFAKGNVVDKDKTIKIILNEFRNGKLGQISIERVEDVNFWGWFLS